MQSDKVYFNFPHRGLQVFLHIGIPVWNAFHTGMESQSELTQHPTPDEPVTSVVCETCEQCNSYKQS